MPVPWDEFTMAMTFAIMPSVHILPPVFGKDITEGSGWLITEQSLVGWAPKCESLHFMPLAEFGGSPQRGPYWSPYGYHEPWMPSELPSAMASIQPVSSGVRVTSLRVAPDEPPLPPDVPPLPPDVPPLPASWLTEAEPQPPSATAPHRTSSQLSPYRFM